MNQILLTEDINRKDNKEDNNKSVKRSNNAIDMKKIVIFFAIVIMVFGISLAAIFGYRIKNRDKDTKIPLDSKPNLSIQKSENNASVIILASSEIGLKKMIYSFNNIDEETIELNGRTSETKEIIIPNGVTNLKVKVIDKNNNEVEDTEQFNINLELPNIETSIIEEESVKKVKIIVTTQIDDIKYVKYKWDNEEEEVTLKPEDDSKNRIEAMVDIKRGVNVISIIASTVNNGIENTSIRFSGRKNPEIKVTKVLDKIYIKVTHDIGIKKIEYNINGKEYIYDENAKTYNPEAKEIEYYFKLKEGENTVKVKATSTEDSEEEFRGKKEYRPEENTDY